MKHRIFRQCLTWMGVLAAALTFIFIAAPSQAAGLLIADGGFGGVLKILEHDVQVTVNNGVAVTHVTQVFHNTEKRQVEALYTFPVPKGASVSNFSMWINGREMIGEVLEKKRAREIYNSYKQKRQDPGLLEQKDYKTFEMRIFPIAADARQKVQITYYQELEFDHDWATYVYPLATTTVDNRADSRVSGRFSVDFEVKNLVPIVRMESPSHGGNFLMMNHSPTFYEASLETRDGDLAKDVVLAFKTERPMTGLDIITSKEKREDGYFMLTLTPGKELERLQSGSDFVFILDISGSMAGNGKLNASVNSIDAFIRTLGQDDRFEIIAFNKRPAPLFQTLKPVTPDTLEQGLSFLNSREAAGGTLLEPALATAYKYGNPDRKVNVVLLSDGMTEPGERSTLIRMIQNRPENVRMFCIGVGNNIDRSLLRQMAENAGGLCAFLSGSDDFSRQAAAFRRKLMHPVAEHLKLQFSGLDVYDVEPENLPNLYHGMPIRVYGRYRDDGPVSIQLTGHVNGRRVSTTMEFDLPSENAQNPQIERMWAKRRMDQLKQVYDINKDPDILDEVIRLGETYSITSEYTSFLVLENDAEYKRWKIERRNAGRIKRDRNAMEALRSRLKTLREKSLAGIGPATAENPARKNLPGMKADSQAPETKPVRRQTSQQDVAGSKPADSGQSFDLPKFGGGAMDPVSGLIALALAGGVAVRSRKKKK